MHDVRLIENLHEIY